MAKRGTEAMKLMNHSLFFPVFFSCSFFRFDFHFGSLWLPFVRADYPRDRVRILFGPGCTCSAAERIWRKQRRWQDDCTASKTRIPLADLLLEIDVYDRFRRPRDGGGEGKAEQSLVLAKCISLHLTRIFETGPRYEKRAPGRPCLIGRWITAAESWQMWRPLGFYLQLIFT